MQPYPFLKRWMRLSNQQKRPAKQGSSPPGASALSLIAARYVELPGAMAAGCERMVHPAVVGRNDRLRQRRFIGVMLAAPFFAAGGRRQTLVTIGPRRGSHGRNDLRSVRFLLVRRLAGGCIRQDGARRPGRPGYWRSALLPASLRRREACLAGRAACRGAAVRSLVDRRIAARGAVGMPCRLPSR